METIYTPYQPRPISFLGIETVAGYRLKTYAIHLPGEVFDRSRFARGWQLAGASLPEPRVNAERPGVGFVILHQGRTAEYLVLCWWDRENELPTRVFINDQAGWRAATQGESFCVWDLQVIWSEREAYVATALAGQVNWEQAYLQSVTMWKA